MITLLAGIVIAVAFALVHAAYRQDLKAAQERSSTGSRIVNTPCGSIEYGITGAGPAVLAVHGAGGGYDQGLAFGGGLAGHGFQVISMSRFGYLRTPLPADASAAAQADAHACLLDALGISSAAVIGVSAGAPSSVQLALRHPDRVSALVLVVPALYVPRPGAASSVEPAPGTEFLFRTALRSDFLFWAAMHLARDPLVRGILATPPELVDDAGEAEQRRVTEVLQQILPVSARAAGLVNDAAITRTLERYELERIRVPTLLIGVADDLFGTFDAARYTAEHVMDARFIGYESGGHVWVGHHDEIVREISAFARGVVTDASLRGYGNVQEDSRSGRR
jgi:pimeloyl-ACP methyl ester carboxylesterase